jgi:chromosome segregation ATPase
MVDKLDTNYTTFSNRPDVFEVKARAWEDVKTLEIIMADLREQYAIEKNEWAQADVELEEARVDLMDTELLISDIMSHKKMLKTRVELLRSEVVKSSATVLQHENDIAALEKQQEM